MDAQSGIWTIDEARQSHFFDEALAQAICDLFDKAAYQYAIADLGCGRGSYCHYLESYGLGRCSGYEGTPIQQTALAEHSPIYELDLSLPLIKVGGDEKLLLDYEIVLCLEVGEHVPEDREEVFLNNVCAFVRPTGWLILSWAIPGQGGRGHVNERDNDYIIKQVRQRGLEYDSRRSNALRKASTLPWFKNTLMVFKNKE